MAMTTSADLKRGLRGGAVLAIWTDTAADEAEFHDWYINEHLPERVNIPGFLRGRLYVSAQNEAQHVPKYFMLYEVETIETLNSVPYIERLNDPTDWSRKMIPTLCNSSRTACAISSTQGDVLGGRILTLQVGPRPERSAGLREWLTNEALPATLNDPGVVGIHLCEADVETTQAKDTTEEGSVASEKVQLADWFVMAEAVDERALEAVARELSERPLVDHGAAVAPVCGRYDLMASLAA
jgi:hypothetical protein